MLEKRILSHIMTPEKQQHSNNNKKKQKKPANQLIWELFKKNFNKNLLIILLQINEFWQKENDVAAIENILKPQHCEKKVLSETATFDKSNYS